MENKIKLPESVLKVMSILEKVNFECFVIGGAVRDSLLGRGVHDYDITTNATPEQVTELFEKLGYTVVPTGIEHGTVTVVCDLRNIEITTYRADGKYSDGRRPDNVKFCKTLKEDCSRRDFTINALAYNPKVGIVDYFNGLDDLKSRTIRCIGQAFDRFSEDKLRALRAIRFENTLPDFHLARGLDLDIILCRQIDDIVSAERIREELNKILATNKPIKHIDLLPVLLPTIFPKYIPDTIVGALQENHFKGFVHNLTNLIICDILDIDVLDKLKYDNSIKKTVTETMECYYILVENFPYLSTAQHLDYFLKKHLLSKFSKNSIDGALLIQESRNLFAINTQRRVENVIKDIEKSGNPISRKDLAISGNDLLELGFKGEEIGEIFDELLRYVWKYPENNRKTLLIEYVRKGAKNSG